MAFGKGKDGYDLQVTLLNSGDLIFHLNKKSKVLSEHTKTYELRKDHINRNRNEMINIVLHNNTAWKSFCTLTFSKYITREQALKNWNNYTNSLKRKTKTSYKTKKSDFI